ncbi:hypothetical protein [Neptuniibacter halophilus]|uniref:hypothetical protein n=1 Tax=Neptuniibacter halophilus TaxID=651666 RepID=UPI002572F6D4|nr:hypothetical protein [Neptuniibacter halophilus]
MNIEQLDHLNQQHKLKAVNFIESGHGPMVIEVEFTQDEAVQKELIKDRSGNVVTCQNVKEGYQICLKAGVHEANLVQIETHDEACRSDFADYHKESIPLKF